MLATNHISSLSALEKKVVTVFSLSLSLKAKKKHYRKHVFRDKFKNRRKFKKRFFRRKRSSKKLKDVYYT